MPDIYDDSDDSCKVCHASEYETSIMEDDKGGLICSDCYYEKDDKELMCFLQR